MGSGGTKVVHVPELATETKTRNVPMYRVLLHNDDVTPMDFVVFILSEIFRKEFKAAFNIMLEAHANKVALIVIEPLERAEFHAEQVKSLARPRLFPLTVTYEPEE
jgi:ATP-dependent Clp protease adaptor protein ClpS